MVATLCIGKEKCFKKIMFIVNQKDIYIGTFAKRISQKEDLMNYFYLFFSSLLSFLLFVQFLEIFCLMFDFDRNFLGWKNSVRNNRLNINNKIFKIIEKLLNTNWQIRWSPHWLKRESKIGYPQDLNWDLPDGDAAVITTDWERAKWVSP